MLCSTHFSELAGKMLGWFFTNYIEVIATLTGLIYLVYSVKGAILLWLFGIITSLLYVYIFFRAAIYADMGINVYYVLISIYGWFHWKYGTREDKKELPVQKLGIHTGIVLLLVSLLIFILIAIVLDRFTDSDIVGWDAFTTAFSITATWMLARKIKEHWLVWIVVDLVSAGLYIYKQLYPTVLLFVVYTTLAIVGYFSWQRIWREQQT